MGLWLPVEGGLKPLFDNTVSDAQHGIDTDGEAVGNPVAVQAGPSASAFNRRWACRVWEAAALPFLVSSANGSRSASERRTMYFFFMVYSV
jgi:hypothetical protein